MGVPNRLGMKDWIVLETLEDAHNMTAAQIAIDWNGNDKYLTRYRRDSGYAIGGGIADNITGLATLAECASWDAKQEREHKAARAQGGRGSGHRKEGELYT